MIEPIVLPPILRDRLPKFGPIGQVVYERTYRHMINAREVRQAKKEGRTVDPTYENWAQTVMRVVDGNTSLVDPKYIEDGEREALYDLFFDMKELPGGRHLNASGVKDRQFVFNCHASGWDPEEPAAHFTFLFDQLMQGGGVGSNYSNRYLEQMPRVTTEIDLHIICSEDHPDIEEFRQYLSHHNPAACLTKTDHGFDRAITGAEPGYFKVSDDREGWVESVAHVFKVAFSKIGRWTVTIDVSGIREKGSLLVTSGGIACGPGPLVTMLHDVVNRLNACVGRQLLSDDAMDIDHLLARCVVAGGKRRSSRMSVKNWRDFDIINFINCKEVDGANWTTNISVETDDEFTAAYANPSHDYHHRARDVMRYVIRGQRMNGEPGLWNRSLSMIGERDPELVFCPNPCGEIILYMWENCFAGDEKLITKEHGSVRFVDVVGQQVTVPTPQGWKVGAVSQFGEQNVQRVTFAPVRRSTGVGFQKTKSNLRTDVVVTPNHRWEKTNGEVTTNLSVGDVVPMSAASFHKNEAYKDGVRHGIIFGDGSADRQYIDGDWRHRARLFGAKAKEMAQYFEHLTYPESCNGAPEAWLKSEKNLKEFPTGSEGADYLAGFVTGWGMADASDTANGAMHLGSSHPQAEAWLRQNAAAAGWVLRAARDGGTTETNYGKRTNPLMFFTLCPPNVENLAWEVVSIEKLSEKIPVYCVTVPGVERFTLASGILTMNCNIGHVNLQAFVGDHIGAEKAFRLMARYLYRATFADVPQKRQQKVLAENRRIGCGFFGFAGWLALHGIKYSECWKNEFVQKRLARYHQVAVESATEYANQMGSPVPVKFTTNAPNGSISLLPGVQGGMQGFDAIHYRRLVRFASMDPRLEVERKEGYPVHTDPDAPNTEIVTYWCENPIVQTLKARGFDPNEVLETQDQVSFSDSLEVQAMVQSQFADNAISFTINLPEDKLPTEEEMERDLMRVYPRLKGTTVFVDRSRKNAPIQRITKAEFDAYTGRKEVHQNEVECVGACPVK